MKMDQHKSLDEDYKQELAEAQRRIDAANSLAESLGFEKGMVATIIVPKFLSGSEYVVKKDMPVNGVGEIGNPITSENVKLGVGSQARYHSSVKLSDLVRWRNMSNEQLKAEADRLNAILFGHTPEIKKGNRSPWGRLLGRDAEKNRILGEQVSSSVSNNRARFKKILFGILAAGALVGGAYIAAQENPSKTGESDLK